MKENWQFAGDNAQYASKLKINHKKFQMIAMNTYDNMKRLRAVFEQLKDLNLRESFSYIIFVLEKAVFFKSAMKFELFWNINLVFCKCIEKTNYYRDLDNI